MIQTLKQLVWLLIGLVCLLFCAGVMFVTWQFLIHGAGRFAGVSGFSVLLGAAKLTGLVLLSLGFFCYGVYCCALGCVRPDK